MVEIVCDGQKFMVRLLYADMYAMAVDVTGHGRLELTRNHKNDCYSARIGDMAVYVDGEVMS